MTQRENSEEEKARTFSPQKNIFLAIFAFEIMEASFILSTLDRRWYHPRAPKMAEPTRTILLPSAMAKV